ncbi:MAG: hypothetical protein ACWGN1_01690, partial [Desulfobulbales bacterium]
MGHHSRVTAGHTVKDRSFQEIGSIRKKWKNRTPIALIFPNTYQLGMSNLGFQVVYRLLNQEDSVVSERIFLPAPGEKPLSVESGRPLADFPLLFFSVNFEQDYLNLVMLLEMSGIAAFTAERTKLSPHITANANYGQPLVVVGGVAAFMNPEPLAPFVDLFIVGEAEPVLGAVMERLLNGIGRRDRTELLAGIGADIPGCYIPALYDVAYDSTGHYLRHTPKEGYPDLPHRVKKQIMTSTGNIAGHSSILADQAEFSNLFMTELGRGCSHGCRFCAAGFIYRDAHRQAQPVG